MWLETLQNRSSVAHTGFEPVISALRGRCPRPLDECAAFCLLAFFNSYAAALILPISKRIVNSIFWLLAPMQEDANRQNRKWLPARPHRNRHHGYLLRCSHAGSPGRLRLLS